MGTHLRVVAGIGHWVVACLALSVFATSQGAWAAPKPFVPVGLQDYDGTSWSSIALGTTTVGEVTRRYATGKSKTPMPNSVYLTQPKNAPQEVWALSNGAKRNPLVTAILIRYQLRALLLGDLIATAAEPGAAYYQPVRHQNWWVVLFRHKGLVALVLRENGRDNVLALLLLRPACIPQKLEGYTTEMSSVSYQPDPHATEPLVMEFGTVKTEFRVTGRLGVTVDEKERLVSSLRSATAKGFIRYRPGATGTYMITVSGSIADNGSGSMQIAAELSGLCPYGQIKETADTWQIMSGTTANGGVNGDMIVSWTYTALLAKVRSEVENEVIATMRSRRPDSPEETREAAWETLQTGLQTASPKLPAP